MIRTAEAVPANSEVEADICIVGSGAAGIPLALALVESGLKVTLLESGDLKHNKQTQALYAGELSDERLHSPPDKYRHRRLGGSTAIWGGRCMPFDPIDFEAREYVPFSGWPITFADLKPYYPPANSILEAGEYLYDADDVFDADRMPMFQGFHSKRLRTNSLERFSCPTNLGARYYNRLAVADNLDVITGANCTNIHLLQSGEQVDSLSVASLSGHRFKVKAQSYVLAVGGIETARLLLASNDVATRGIGNEHDLVGRYYQCHIAGNVGNLTINGTVDPARHGYEVSPEGIYCRRRLCLSEETQRQEKLLNMVARLHFPRIVDPSHKSGVLSGLFFARFFISYEYSKRLKDGNQNGMGVYLKHLRNIVLDSFDTVRFLSHWLLKRTFADRKFPSVILRNKTNRFSLEVHGEQTPNFDSRIVLTDEKDALGMPRVKVDWKYLPQDVESVRKTLRIIAEEVNNSGIGHFEFNEDTFEQDLMRFGAYGGHHIGTARMGDDPQKSVVNSDCRLHAVNNLYIASSAVFPTSSQANPTLTITAMALRLADHLKAKHIKSV